MASQAIITKLLNGASKALSGLRKEESLLQTLHQEVKAALARLVREDTSLKQYLEQTHAYAVFPSVGQAAAVLGGAFGKGEVFEQGNLVGYAALVQATLGLQLGGQTFTQIIAFEDKAALNRFKKGNLKFTANAAAALVKAGAAAATRFDRGAAVLVYSEGGLLLELGIGAQKFIYGPAVLGRGRAAPEARPSSRRKPAPPRKHAEAKPKARTSNKRSREPRR